MGSTQQTKTSCFRARESPWFLGGDCHGFKSDPARLHLLSGIQHDYLTTQREFQRDCQNLIHLSMLIYTLWIWHETHETQEWPYPLSTRENHLWNSQIRGSILNGVCLIMGYDGPSQNCNFKRDKDFSTKVFFPLKCQVPFRPQRRKPTLQQWILPPCVPTSRDSATLSISLQSREEQPAMAT